jgi:hypothetical protein
VDENGHVSTASELSAEEVLDGMFTTVNPATGSEPPDAAWVLFANDTFFLTAPGDELPAGAAHGAIAEAALEALWALGPVVPGTAAADFSCSRLAHFFPDDHVWIVFFGGDDVGGVVVGPESELEAGLDARANRDADCDEERIVLVRSFDGSVERP